MGMQNCISRVNPRKAIPCYDRNNHRYRKAPTRGIMFLIKIVNYVNTGQMFGKPTPYTHRLLASARCAGQRRFADNDAT